MFGIDAAVVAIFIPIIVVIGVFAAVITSVVVSGKQKELEHKERLVAMEKGMPIPEKPLKEKRPLYLSLRAWGFVFVALGIALVFAIGAEAGFTHGLWGLIPLLVGLSLLLASNLEKKDNFLKKID